jgi:hypothetical protein
VSLGVSGDSNIQSVVIMANVSRIERAVELIVDYVKFMFFFQFARPQ